jgi:hypothetical protein
MADGASATPVAPVREESLSQLPGKSLRRLIRQVYSGAPGMSVSPDGKYLLYVQLDEARNRVMMAENFR